MRVAATTAVLPAVAPAAELTVRQKLMLGAIGAITPLALNLLVVDQLALASLTPLVLAGYLIRVVILVGIGAVVVFLNIDEGNRVRVFQLGLAAPALLTSLLNGANGRALQSTQQFVTPPTGMFIATLHAQEAPPSQQFSLPKETAGAQVWRGLTGSRSDRVWFVIAKREPTQKEAAASAGHINRTYKGFRAEVYEPYQGHGSWSVVIGGALTRAEAMDLRQKAIAAGMADADLWTPPEAQEKK